MDFDRKQLANFYLEAQRYGADTEAKELTSTNVGRYQEIAEYAHGGVKSIIRTKDLMTKREVAKAVMRKAHAAEGKERFLREAVINSVLEHPNIMPVYDIGFDKEHEPFFIMKFVPGNDLGGILKELVKRNPYFLEKYPLNKLLSIFVKICDAVAYAHSKGVIHRDLKPANIKVGEFGEVLVCDWGLGKFVSDEAHDETVDFAGIDYDLFSDGVTIDTMLKGTPGYMSPEQITGGVEDVDMLSDIYALGAILYSILTFKRPFAGLPLKKVLAHTVDGKLTLPSQVSSHNVIPPGLEAVVTTAMCPDPNHRYQSVEQLREEVNSYLNGFATAAEKANFTTQLKLFYQRNRRVCISIISFTLILISLTTFFIITLRKNEQGALKALAMYEQEKEAKLHAEEKLITERSKHLEAFEKYSQIKEESKSVVLDLIRKAEANRYSYLLVKAKKQIANALSLDPGNGKILELKAKICIALCEFQQVLYMVEQKQLANEHPLAKIALKYSLMPLNKRGRLKDAQSVVALANDLVKAGKMRIAIDLLGQEHYTHRSMEEYGKVVACWLLLDNPKMETINIKISQGQYGIHIDLSGNKNLKKIRAVYGIKIGCLDISNTAVSALASVKRKPFLYCLNVAGSKVPDLKEIKEIVNLKRLVVEEGQFPKSWLKKLPDRISLEVIPRKQ